MRGSKQRSSKPNKLSQEGSHPKSSQGSGQKQSIPDETHQSNISEDAKRTYPCCDCPCDGPHSPNCMFQLYQQMTDNYQMTTDLARQYINQMTKDPMELEIDRRLEEVKQDIYRQFRQQKTDKPIVKADKQEQSQRHSMLKPKPTQFISGNQGMFGEGNMQQLMMSDGEIMKPESQTRKLMEEQQRTKNLWVQFMNIFDMALDLADEATNARWMLNCQRKEDERLACKKRIEEAGRDWYKHCLDKQASTQTPAQGQQNKEKKSDKKDLKTTEEPQTKQTSQKTETEKAPPKQSAISDKNNAEEEPQMKEETVEPEPKVEETEENPGGEVNADTEQEPTIVE